ncbi:hypothetical protein TRAPUB_9746 [Trametes pubescens]|uniref:Uncharacterized protein n=1 Tax=Trametes pubescens TaxID=154538 RepID=A0A1M2W1R4_TRAPU|nr:hypothetical protein TRAPUB_9746 [Trametes pubescens]
MNLNVIAGLPEYCPAVQNAVPGAAGKQGGVMNNTSESFPAYMDWPDAQTTGHSTQPEECFFTPTHGVATSESYGANYDATYDAPYDALSTTMPFFHPH